METMADVASSEPRTQEGLNYLMMIGVMSSMGALCVLGSFLLLPGLRHNAALLILWLTLCDFGFSLRYSLLLFTPYTYQALWAQFFGTGSLVWNAVISIDMLISLRNPWLSTSTSTTRHLIYHASCWGIAFISTAIAYFTHSLALGPGPDGYAWLRYGQPPFVFLVPFVISALCVIITLCLSFTPVLISGRNRTKLVSRQFLLLVLFLVCWGTPCIAYFLQRRLVWVVANIVIALIGLGDAVVWFTSSFFLDLYKRCWTKLRRCCCKPSQTEDELTRSLLEAGTTSSGSGVFGGSAHPHSAAEIQRIGASMRRNTVRCLLIGIRMAFGGDHSAGKATHTQDADNYVITNGGEFEPTPSMPVYTGASFPVLSAVPKVMTFRLPKFTVHFPELFDEVLAASGITHELYVQKLDPTALMEALKKYTETKSSFDAGRSGSFFLTSGDKSLVVKTIPSAEAEVLKRILPKYVRYIVDNKSTILVRFFGLYTIDVAGNVPTNAVIMENVFFGAPDLQEIYDLKGSWVNRASHDKRKSKLISTPPSSPTTTTSTPTPTSSPIPTTSQSSMTFKAKTTVGKDMDLRRYLHLDTETKEAMTQVLSEDSKFLCDLGLMDYSLLLGFHFVSSTKNALHDQLPSVVGSPAPSDVHSRSDSSGSNDPPQATQFDEDDQPPQTTAAQPTTQEMKPVTSEETSPYVPGKLGRRVLVSEDGQEVYVLGIIDILQEYNRQKQAEKFVKTTLLREDRHGVSVQDPAKYSERFIRHWSDKIACVPSFAHLSYNSKTLTSPGVLRSGRASISSSQHRPRHSTSQFITH